MASLSSDRVLRGNPGNESELANAIRALAMDAVQQAKSGHPGAPMGMAEMAVALWHGQLKHNPANPFWPDRDRFVLSNGHASMLMYALLHLTGYELPIAELKKFRQLHSKTPGHPEVDVTPGVETTTGPLGQGISNGVGLALAEKLLADEFNKPDHNIVDHHTWVFLGDGCLMEGISHESCALAGALGLNKLVAMYDANGISIDGDVKNWFIDDTAMRFRAYGWTVVESVDGHDIRALDDAITLAKQSQDKPVLIVCNTTIGAGSPARHGTAKAHGEPLGPDEVTATRAAINWPYAAFEIPQQIKQQWNAREKGAESEGEWNNRFANYALAYPSLATEFKRRLSGELADASAALFSDTIKAMSELGETMASRKASQQVLASIAPLIPELIGGSADLTGSNLTDFPDCGAVRRGQAGGRHINYGVREFGMAAIMNGMALHGGFIPYGGTFLTFSDYSRNAIRMAALMKRRVVHVFTHDSIGLGEDGPTHQSVEHAASLRLIPNLDVWRPCDGPETAQAWASAIDNTSGPSALLLSRQALPAQTRDTQQLSDMSRGAYILSDRSNAQAVILATGSEVGLAMDAQRELDDAGVPVRVVSMPSSSIFDKQNSAYKQSVLGQGLPRVGVEAGVTSWWGQYGCVSAVGVDTFGESAPAGDLFDHFNLTAQAIVLRVRHAIDSPQPI
ncbi:MAG: transketolase [Granulosicoccaceae bacterium]